MSFIQFTSNKVHVFVWYTKYIKMYALDKNKKGRIGLTTPKWWGKTRRRVEESVV